MFKKEIRMQILALFLISIGGLMLHMRVHSATLIYIPPVVVGLMSALLLPFLFNNAKTVALAFLLNTAAVVIGTITMGAFSFLNPPKEITLYSVIFQTLLMDIIILWAKFPLGLSILRHFRPAGQATV